MIVCFDLPELVDEFEEQEDCRVEPCFPYLPRGERPGEEIDMWDSVVRKAPYSLTLKKTAGTGRLRLSREKKKFEPRVLLKVRC